MASCGFCQAKPSEEVKLKNCVCKKISYCSKDCQAKDWKAHKPSCPPFVMRESPGRGRGLFATRRIKEGGIIIDESPLITIKQHWSEADMLARAEAAVLATEAGQLDIICPVGEKKMNFHEFKTGFYPNIEENTKAKILETHDPAENLLDLDTETVERLRRKNPYEWLTEDAKGDDEVCKIWLVTWSRSAERRFCTGTSRMAIVAPSAVSSSIPRTMAMLSTTTSPSSTTPVSLTLLTAT